MMASAAALLLIAFVLTGRASAFDEPDGFRDMKWGEGEASVRAKLGYPTCLDYGAANQWLGDRFCSSWVNIGDIRTDVTVTFRADKLVGLSLAFDVKDYDQMVAAFVEKFGRPAEVKEEVLRTRAGVEYVNQTLRWNGPTVAIRLSKYGSRVTHSLAHYELHAERETKRKLREEGASKAAKGL